MRLMFALPLFAFAACTPTDAEDSGAKLDADTEVEECKGTAPEIVSVEVTEGEPIEGEDGALQPTIVLVVEFEDADGDAHEISMDIWTDTEIDGTVDTSGKADSSLDRTAMTDNGGDPVEACEGEGGTLALSMGVTGDPLDFETEYDFAVVVYDVESMASNVGFATGTTPAELTE